jgi:plasmid stabilization system protein ParE
MVTVWSKKAAKELNEVYLYIYKDSPQNAKKVRDEIIDYGESLVKNPESHPPDKYRIDNDGSFRAFELYRYRVAYKILEEIVLIVRVRHTSRSPLSY